MSILTTTRPLPGDSPSAMLPEGRTDEPESGWFVLGTWLILSVVALGFVTRLRKSYSAMGGLVLRPLRDRRPAS